jgi:hypothetical protein
VEAKEKFAECRIFAITASLPRIASRSAGIPQSSIAPVIATLVLPPELGISGIGRRSGNGWKRLRMEQYGRLALSGTLEVFHFPSKENLRSV